MVIVREVGAVLLRDIWRGVTFEAAMRIWAHGRTASRLGYLAAFRTRMGCCQTLISMSIT